jgi:hypothetical protein
MTDTLIDPSKPPEDELRQAIALARQKGAASAVPPGLARAMAYTDLKGWTGTTRERKGEVKPAGQMKKGDTIVLLHDRSWAAGLLVEDEPRFPGGSRVNYLASGQWQTVSSQALLFYPENNDPPPYAYKCVTAEGEKADARMAADEAYRLRQAAPAASPLPAPTT